MLGYTGQEKESDLGLYYYGARFYDPDTGRFLSNDPARQYWGGYTAFGNNPIAVVDQDGLVGMPIPLAAFEPLLEPYIDMAAQKNEFWAADLTMTVTASTPVDFVAPNLAVSSPKVFDIVDGGYIMRTDVFEMNSGVMYQFHFKPSEFDGLLSADPFFGPIGFSAQLAGRIALRSALARHVAIDSTKFDYLLGAVKSSAHNTARSRSMALEFKRLGIINNPAGRKILEDHLRTSALTSGNVIRTFTNEWGAFEVRQSLLFGPSGKALYMDATFQVYSNGSRRFVTAIPKR